MTGTDNEKAVPERILRAHGLKSMNVPPTPSRLREMAAAFIAAADETEESL